jgi:hypothetical protein
MKGITLAVAGAALAVGLAATGLGVANAVTSTSTYHGCVEGTSRTLEHVYTSKTPTCPSGSFAANWNQTGPQGPAGRQGLAGPQGPPGTSTAGPAGLDEIETFGLSGGHQSVAYCPDDHPYVLSGGFRTAPGDTSVQQDVINSEPILPSSQHRGQWGVYIEWSSNGVDSVQAYAICAK